MSFLNLIRREVYWILKSPALLWSLLPLLLMVHLFPAFLWSRTGLTIAEAEGMWNFLNASWPFVIKPKIQQDLLMSSLLTPYLPLIEEVLKIPSKELWPRYLVPALQLFAIFPLAALIPPLAVSVFKKDLNHGAFRQLSMNGTHGLVYLFAKLAVLIGYSFVLNMLCLWVAIGVYHNIPDRGEWFVLYSTSWMTSHLVAIGFAAWVAVVSWWGCLGSRNGCSEIYLASVVGGAGLGAMLIALQTLGISQDVLLLLGSGLLFSSPVGLMVLWIRMRQASFVLNH